MPSEVNTAKSAEAKKESGEAGTGPEAEESKHEPTESKKTAKEPEASEAKKELEAKKEPKAPKVTTSKEPSKPGEAADDSITGLEETQDLEKELEEAPTEPVDLEEAPTSRVDIEDAPTVPLDLEDAPTRRVEKEVFVTPAPAPAPGLSSRSAERVGGTLRRSRSGPVRVLFWITALALLAWIGRWVLALLGYRHPATVFLSQNGLEIVGERRFMGLRLGETRRLVPFSSIQLVDLVARSGLWVLVAAVVALALAAGIGITLVVWGISGGEPSWIVGGLVAIGLGVLLDALAYLWVRFSARRGLADLTIQVRGARMRLTSTPHVLAQQLVDRIARHD
jgi:hypothetical protein